jgi:hypothetical protein
VIERARETGVDGDALAAKLQSRGRDLFVESWNELLKCVDARRNAMKAA